MMTRCDNCDDQTKINASLRVMPVYRKVIGDQGGSGKSRRVEQFWEQHWGACNNQWDGFHGQRHCLPLPVDNDRLSIWENLHNLVGPHSKHNKIALEIYTFVNPLLIFTNLTEIHLTFWIRKSLFSNDGLLSIIENNKNDRFHFDWQFF